MAAVVEDLTGRTLGPYKLVKRLGQGGMGAVYRGVHRILDQPRAIKVMVVPPYLSGREMYVRLFEREARLASKLRHPHVVQIFDVTEQDGLHFIVMELLEGESLAALAQKASPLPLGRAIRLLRQLGEALDYAHAQGIVHRDLKPANAFVGPNDHLTLVDFGIARASDETHLPITAGIGTLAYMAPEVFDESLGGEGSDTQMLGVSADLYGLGVVAYELLTGRLPFAGTNRQIMSAHLHRQPPSPCSLRPDLPATCEPILLRQLAKEPIDRFPAAGVFVEALDQAIRLDSLLFDARLALRTHDDDRAVHLLDQLRVHASVNTKAHDLIEAIEERQWLRNARARIQERLAAGDWRATLAEIESLRAATDPRADEFQRRAEALQCDEAIRIEAERQAAEEQRKRFDIHDRAGGLREPVEAGKPVMEAVLPVGGTDAKAAVQRVERLGGSTGAARKSRRPIGVAVIVVALLSIIGWIVYQGDAVRLVGEASTAPTSSRQGFTPTISNPTAGMPPTLVVGLPTAAAGSSVPSAVVKPAAEPVQTPALPVTIPLTPTVTLVLPTATPAPEQRIVAAQNTVASGDFGTAIEQLQVIRQDSEAMRNGTIAQRTNDLLRKTHVAFGNQLLDQGELDHSWGEFSAALELASDDLEAMDGRKRVILAKNYARMETEWGQNDNAAIQALEENMQLDSDFRETRSKLYALLLAKADRLLNLGKRDDAFPILMRALSVLPQGDETRERLASYTPTPSPPTRVPVVNPTPVVAPTRTPLPNPTPQDLRMPGRPG